MVMCMACIDVGLALHTVSEDLDCSYRQHILIQKEKAARGLTACK